MRKIYLVAVLWILAYNGAFAATLPDSTEVSPDTTEVKPPVKKKKLSLTPFPALFSTPETGIGYGALVVPVYNFGSDSLTRNSNGQLLAYYTQKKQSSIQLTYTVYTNLERYVVIGEASYYDSPILYYGVGNHNTLQDSSLISYKLLLFQNRVLKQIKRYVFVGGQYQLIRVKNVEFKNPQSKLQERSPEELDGSLISGLGPSFLFDSRDNPLNAAQGWYLDAGVYLNQKGLGSEFNFTRYAVDVRKYLKIKNNQVLALQGMGKFSSGMVPFREMALLGGGRMMRGFYEGRFRDRQLLAMQAEYRYQLFSRVGLVAFGSLGGVGNGFKDLGLSELKPAAGGGVRLMLNRKEKLNIRIDYAVGSDKASGFYFAIGEAF